MEAIDIIARVLRPAAILTTSYVGVLVSSVLDAGGPRMTDFNQLVLYIDYTKGSATTAELIIEFQPADNPADLYQETDETISVASNVDTLAVNTKVHQFTVTGKYRIAIPIADGDVKVSVKGTGTMTSSSMKVTAGLGKTFA